MNHLESLIHDLLRYSPKTRSLVVSTYQSIFYFLGSKKEIIPAKFTFLPSFFFGFHDKCPWSANDQFFLSHQIPNSRKMIQPSNCKIRIGYFEKDLKNFHAIGETTAWNWQQGSTLQWIGPTTRCSHHEIKRNTIISIWTDISTMQTVEIPRASAAFSPLGDEYISYDFKRFGFGAEGYGYTSLKLNKADLKNITSSRLEIRSVENDELSNSIEMEQAIEIAYQNKCPDGYFYISHALYSPSGNKISFFLRHKKSNGGIVTKLFFFDKIANVLSCSSVFDSSHISWINDDELLAFCIPPYSEKQGYFLIDSTDLSVSPYEPLPLNSDGHPYFCTSSSLLVTDTYPDRYRIQRLYLSDPEKGLNEIAAIRIPLRYRGSFRCDFHPRLNRSCDKISIDTVFRGNRGTMIIPIQ